MTAGRTNSATRSRRSAAATVRERVAQGGARYWKHADFGDLPAAAVATALSRLARDDALRRVGKGVYYRPAPTSFGVSVPGASATAAQLLVAPVHPAGLSAANLLGLSTQNPGCPEYATTASAPPSPPPDRVSSHPAERGNFHDQH
jgi:hypothetical protein